MNTNKRIFKPKSHKALEIGRANIDRQSRGVKISDEQFKRLMKIRKKTRSAKPIKSLIS
jgi:hypothetical protein